MEPPKTVTSKTIDPYSELEKEVAPGIGDCVKRVLEVQLKIENGIRREDVKSYLERLFISVPPELYDETIAGLQKADFIAIPCISAQHSGLPWIESFPFSGEGDSTPPQYLDHFRRHYMAFFQAIPESDVESRIQNAFSLILEAVVRPGTLGHEEIQSFIQEHLEEVNDDNIREAFKEYLALETL